LNGRRRAAVQASFVIAITIPANTNTTITTWVQSQ
jgi:hypothetical protein